MTTSKPQKPKPDLLTRDRELNSYLREQSTADAALLGSVVLMQVGAIKDVTRKDLMIWFNELDLDPAFLPNEPRPVDAFESATGAAKTKYPLGVGANGRKKQTHEKTGQTVTLMMRHVMRDENRVVRHLVRELADHADEALSYEVKLAEAEFLRKIGPTIPIGSGDMTLVAADDEIDKLSTFEQSLINDLIAKVRKNYNHSRQHIASARISGMLRDYLEGRCGAIRLQNGVYFVPQRFNDILTSLRLVAARCDATINRIPLPDNDEQRAMVDAAFNAKTATDLDSLARDIAREQAAGAATFRVTKLYARFHQVKKDAEEYQENLGAELGDTAARLELINTQMANLLASVDSQDDDA